MNSSSWERLVLLTVIGQVSLAAAQVVSAPAPTAPNSQGLPWWCVKHQYTPGMPWSTGPPARPPRGSAGSRPGIRRSSRTRISGVTR